MMRGIVVAFGFLTRLPMPRIEIDGSAQAASLKWYPWVGLVLGALLVAVYTLLRGAPSLPLAAIVIVVWIVLTGALHLDGLADSADAWIGGMGDRDRTLAIMKDPRSGPAGVVALVGVLLLKFSALATLDDPWLLLLPLVLGRAALVALFLSTRYVRAGGLGEPLRGASAIGCGISLVLAVVVAVCFRIPGLVALATALVVGVAWRRACIARIGGFTGDTAGALTEMIEASTLVALACLH